MPTDSTPVTATAADLPAPLPGIREDDGFAVAVILEEQQTENELLRLIAERIRIAAGHLRLTREDLERIFRPHTVFEGETTPAAAGGAGGFILVETHHLIQGKVGKGALKLVFPEDLADAGTRFRVCGSGELEVLPVPGRSRWNSASEAEAVVKATMREFMTGETLSMSLKCQASGAPFSGSEGLLLCATRRFDPATGQYWLGPAVQGRDDALRADKRVIEGMMNQAAEMLTRVGRIGFNTIVHAAETNSTLTARLDLQLPTNVVEGHLRALLQEHPQIVIGDDDMTARLRELWARRDYEPTACVLARAAARMQLEHSVLLSGSRERLRTALARLPSQGALTPGQYREVVDLFFGTGEIQQNEDQLFHQREAILKVLSVALTARSLDDCGEPEVLGVYLRTLLDNQRIMLEAALLRRLPQGQALPMDWFDRRPLLTSEQQRRLAALMPGPGITRDKVKEHFWEIVTILCEAKADLPRYTPDPYLQARKDVLERATTAITSSGDLLPAAERVVFFTLPFTYECVTPKLGVVTRKPVDLCGSELRPEAMALGGVMAIEILLKRLTRKANPLRNLTVAIEGLGNAGKHLATLMLQKGARIVGVSDSRGALVNGDGFTREELAIIIAHKNAGRRLDTLLASAAARGLSERAGAGITFDPHPETLKRSQADVLILAAIPASVDCEVARQMAVQVVGELAGGAVTNAAKQVLSERHIHVVPDNLASSGGLLVSLSEMLQNSAGQNWDRKLEEYNLYDQLARSYDEVLKVARRHGVDAATASDILAVRRMHEHACYRQHLEAAAARLAERIRQLPAGEPVLVVSDDDEDGVASAAMLHGLIAELNPGAEHGVTFLSESFRSVGILSCLDRAETAGAAVKHVFVLDRGFPLGEPGQGHLASIARRCCVTFINNHPTPAFMLDPAAAAKPPAMERVRTPAELGILFISPQTLRATIPARENTTAMVLKEIAHSLIADERLRLRLSWQAAVGSCLDVPPEPSSEWLWFFSQFHPDRTREAARALRMVTRAGGFLNAVQALIGVTRPDQLETHPGWKQFMTEYQMLDERVQVLVEKILVENRGRPVTAHFFTPDEIASPTPVAGNAANELDLHQWISEHLTRRGDLAEKPVIVGQVVRDTEGRQLLGVRIRSPRGVDLAEVGLPPAFVSGGLPNTAVARLPLERDRPPEALFYEVVDAIWIKASSPLYLAPVRNAAP